MTETIIYSSEQVQKQVIDQNEARLLWVENDTPEAVSQMIIDEAQELYEAIQEAFITGDVFSVASELGDVQYLLYKLSHQLGIDLKEATRLKNERNARKYPDTFFSDGDYSEKMRMAKLAWEAMGGDKAFSHAYLDFLSE